MRILVLLSLLLPSIAFANEDTDHLQKMISILQQQRNQAMDAIVIADTRASELQEQLDKALARIKELEDGGCKLPDKPKDGPAK